MLVTVAAALALGIHGLSLEDKLSPSSLSVPGTESDRGGKLLSDNFGPSAPFAILLRGPQKDLDAQGPELIRKLREEPGVTTLSPWDLGPGAARLRRSPEKALIVADYHVGIRDAVEHTLGKLDAAVDATISEPVDVRTSGFATLSKAIQDESIDATQQGEIIAAPILILVLLLVFRSVAAALIPLILGALTVLVSRGVLAVLTGWVDIDAFALAVSSMMGLALGVDYSLLMVSRFREELTRTKTAADAAEITRRTAGRTIVFAGTTLFASMLVCFLLLPGSLLISLAGSVMVVTAVSVLIATFAGAAILTLLGERVNLLTIGSSQASATSGWLGPVQRALRHPAVASVVIGVAVLALAAPAHSLDVGPPSPEQLPESDQARKDFELIENEVGPGWETPFVIVAEANDGLITEPKRLTAIANWQNKIAQDSHVRTVFGPGNIGPRIAPVRRLGNQLISDSPKSQINRGTKQLAQASKGAKRLVDGLLQAGVGAQLIADAPLPPGSQFERFASGTKQAAGGARQASLGSLNLSFGVDGVRRGVTNNTKPEVLRTQSAVHDIKKKLDAISGPAQSVNEDLASALNALQAMTAGKGDPRYNDALNAVQGAVAAAKDIAPTLGDIDKLVDDAISDADKLALGVGNLEGDLTRIHSGSKQLVIGSRSLANANSRIAKGANQFSGVSDDLQRLASGAEQLANGLTRLGGGAGRLSGGLQNANQRADRLNQRLDRLRNGSPGIFDSSYFVLSTLDGAPAATRERAGQGINVDDGGNAVALLAIPTDTVNTPEIAALNNRLDDDADGLARDADVQAAVTGGAAQLDDYDTATSARIPLVIAVVSLITYLVLIVVMRALLLPLLAVILNLMTVAAAFGVLAIVPHIPGLSIGGDGYMDAVGAVSVFGVVFGLSIDYAVFLLSRMREGRSAGLSNEESISFGLDRTAGVITGAAAIMGGVFVAFAVAPIDTISQVGIALTVAVTLDATVIRLILLPALMKLIGDKVWWLPGWLDRSLPRFDLEGEAAEPSAPAPVTQKLA